MPQRALTPQKPSVYAPLRALISTFCLFPLHRGGGFGGNVIADTVNALDLVDNAHRHPVQHIIGNAGPVSGHEVVGGHGPEGQSVVIGAAVAHDAHRAGVGQDGKVLVDTVVQTGPGDLIPEDKVGLTEGVGLLLGDVADDADGQAGTGEGLAGNQVFRQAQLCLLYTSRCV